MKKPVDRQKSQDSGGSVQVVVLGAGAPRTGNEPPALTKVRSGLTALEWIIDATNVGIDNVNFVGGFHVSQVREQFPKLSITKNPRWRESGSCVSLFTAPIDEHRPLLACYGDILFRHDLMDALANSTTPVTIAWDSEWLLSDSTARSFEDREKVIVAEAQIMRAGYDIPVGWASGEFVGVVHFSSEIVALLRNLHEKMPEFLDSAQLSGLVEYLRIQGIPIGAVDVRGDWGEVADEQDIARFILGTKSQTLIRLQRLACNVTIQDQVSFTVEHWQQEPELILEKVRKQLGNCTLVVRSSARSEDSFDNANAGAYLSVLDVQPDTGLAEAISDVIASYGDAQPDDEVLVQPMVSDVVSSGVVFTRTLAHGAPWYVVNYERSGRTDGVTSGRSTEHRTLYVYRNATFKGLDEFGMEKLLAGIQEIERLLHYDLLDCEYAIDTKGQIHIFQVRPIAALHNIDCQSIDAACQTAMTSARKTWKNLEKSPPHLPGNAPPLYGLMPDWNPAEIIGTAPGRLAESLYRNLVMDDTWAQQRFEYGYRDVRPSPLLISFAGIPYVDVRASFASFIPAAVNDQLAGRLLEFYVGYLASNPELHDKVEFEVVVPCMSLDFDRWKKRLREDGGFDESEIAELGGALQQITSHAIDRWRDDLEKISQLEERYTQIMKSELPAIERARFLLDDCRRLGVLPFAHLARGAFVAMTLLRDAQATGVISEEGFNEFLASIRTVAHGLTEDARATADGTMIWADFVEKYGHLRPGTYDIISPRYDSDPERFLRPLVERAVSDEDTPVAKTERWEADQDSFLTALRDVGISNSVESINAFLRGVIEGREYSKFVFTKNVSAALEALVEAGEDIEMSREVLSDLPLDLILDMPIGGAATSEGDQLLQLIAAENAQARKVAGWCKLPALISEEHQLDVFIAGADRPNFIGTQKIIARSVVFSSDWEKDTVSLEGAIVLIPQADPGYDWLFGQGIAGLITMYGGANSHMAIRVAEFGLPAAIGVGEKTYEELMESNLIEMDPSKHILRALQ